MSKTGAHMINRKDCETLISVSEMIDSKEEYVVVLDNYDSIMNTEEFT